MSLHRLFVALRPPPAIRAHLLGVMDGVAGARWQSDDQLHLTLRFIGEVDHHQAEDIGAALGRVRAGPLSLRIAGVSLFEHRGQPHMLWAGVDPADPVDQLQRRVEAALRGVGVPPETRRFTPHITLARLNRSTGPVAPFIAAHADLASATFTVDAMLLMESEMGHGGSRYHSIARYPL